MSQAAQNMMAGVATNEPALSSHTANVYYTAWDAYTFIDTADANFSQLMLGTGDFCIEIAINTLSGAGCYFSFGTQIGGAGLQFPAISMSCGTGGTFGAIGKNALYGSDGVGSVSVYLLFADDGAMLSNGYVYNWHHVALIRESSYMKFFVDGQLLPTTLSDGTPLPYPEGTTFSADISPTASPFYMFGGPLGQYDAENGLATQAYWRNFRYTVGNAVYNTSQNRIVPPNWWDDLAPVTGTKILMVPGPGVTVSSSGFTNEATGALSMNIQNISPYGNYATIQPLTWPGPSGFPTTVWSAGTNSSQTWTTSGTPSTPKIVTTATSGAPTPVLGTSCGDFTMSGTDVKINAAGSPTWLTFDAGTYCAFDAWIWVPTSCDGKTKVLFAGETSGSFGVMLGTGIGNNTGMEQLGIFTVGSTSPDYAASFTWARGKWNYIAAQRQIVSDGTNFFQSWYFFHGVEGQTNARLVNTSIGTQGALSQAYSTPTSISIGGFSNASTVSSGIYINMIRIKNTNIIADNAINYGSRGTNIPYEIPAVDAQTTQLMVFQGTNGSTTFTNQTS